MGHTLPFFGEDLDLLMDHPTEQDFIHILERLYGAIPATTCLSCGQCCQLTEVERRDGWVTMFPLYAIEYLHIVRYIQEHFSEAEQNVYFGFQEEWPLRCPFQSSPTGVCRIYPARPFTCRAYGVLDKAHIENAVQHYAEDVPAKWLQLFRRYEEHLSCPNVQVTEPHKLDDYIAQRISFRYTRGLEWLSWRMDLLGPKKGRLLREVTGQERIIKWTWGGFNALYFSSEAWLKDHLRVYWEKVELVK